MEELTGVVDRLNVRFGDDVPRDELRRVVDHAAEAFKAARIRAFVPILVERMATDDLRGRRRSA